MAGQGRDWVAIFQDAALDPQRWPDALHVLAEATGSAHGQLLGIGSARTVPFNRVTGFSEQALEEFVAIDGGSPAINFRVAADVASPANVVVYERDYDRARGALRSDAYLDFCEDYRIPFGCHVALTKAEQGLIGLAVLRGRDAGRTTEEQRAEFARAADAARAAVLLQLAIEHRGAAVLAGTLEAIALDCFLLDREGRIGMMTPQAERRVAEATVLRIEDGRLSSPVPAVARSIGLALRAVFGGTARTSISLGDGFGPSLDLFRMESHDWSLSFQPRIIAVVRDAGRRLEEVRERAVSVFGLSPAEADIAILLCQGAKREEITGRRDVSLQTLRTQIKNIYAKMEVSREAELVARLLMPI